MLEAIEDSPRMEYQVIQHQLEKLKDISKFRNGSDM